MRIDGPLVSRRDAPGEDPLALVLRKLVVGVGNLDPVARREQIQVEHVLSRGLEVETVKYSLVVSLVVEGGEFRRIQEAAAPDPVHGQEVPHVLAAETQ